MKRFLALSLILTTAGGMLTSNTPVPARRVLLPLESPMSTWTAVGLFDASIQWAIGATSR